MNDMPPPRPHEQAISTDQPIAALLPRYYEVCGDNPAYETVHSIDMDGHEVAWLRYHGVVEEDITGTQQEGDMYEGYCLECACSFTEGVGWQTDETYGVVNLDGGNNCAKKEAVEKMRHAELHKEYQERGILPTDTTDVTSDNIKEVLLDLINKHEANEFLERTTGAEFWGGHYYLDTASEIIGVTMDKIWQAADELVAEKRIRLEGAIVRSYREPLTARTYAPSDALPEIHLYHEKPDKVWALMPRPEETRLTLDTIEINDKNRWAIIGRCVVGLAHNPELATARLHEAIANPRLSHDRLYQLSFVDPSYHAGALAVLAYSAIRNGQPEEWVVEGFLSDAVVPEVHTIPMARPTMFGIDGEDTTTLNAKVDEWWPVK